MGNRKMTSDSCYNGCEVSLTVELMVSSIEKIYDLIILLIIVWLSIIIFVD